MWRRLLAPRRRGVNFVAVHPCARVSVLWRGHRGKWRRVRSIHTRGKSRNFSPFFFSLFPSVFPPVLVGRGRSIFTFPLPAYRFLPQSAFLAASDSGRNPLQPFFAGLICDQSMRGGERRRRRRSSAKSVEICVHADEWGKYATKKKTTEYRLITYNVLYCS